MTNYHYSQERPCNPEDVLSRTVMAVAGVIIGIITLCTNAAKVW